MWAGKYFMCFSWWTSLFSFKETLLAGQTFGEYIKLDLSALKESEPFIVGAGRCGDAQFHLHCLLSLHLLGPADLFLGSWKEAWGLRKERDKRQRWSPEGFQWLLRLPQVYYLRFLFYSSQKRREKDFPWYQEQTSVIPSLSLRTPSNPKSNILLSGLWLVRHPVSTPLTRHPVICTPWPLVKMEWIQNCGPPQ